jgi:hypothetical protein
MNRNAIVWLWRHHVRENNELRDEVIRGMDQGDRRWVVEKLLELSDLIIAAPAPDAIRIGEGRW